MQLRKHQLLLSLHFSPLMTINQLKKLTRCNNNNISRKYLNKVYQMSKMYSVQISSSKQLNKLSMIQLNSMYKIKMYNKVFNSVIINLIKSKKDLLQALHWNSFKN